MGSLKEFAIIKWKLFHIQHRKLAHKLLLSIAKASSG